MSISNSNVELFETIKVTVIDNDKILFKLHRLGFITGLCGEVIKNHTCVIKNDVKELDVSNVSSVDIYPTFESINKKVDDLTKLWSQGKMEQSLVRYIPGLTKPAGNN